MPEAEFTRGVEAIVLCTVVFLLQKRRPVSTTIVGWGGGGARLVCFPSMDKNCAKPFKNLSAWRHGGKLFCNLFASGMQEVKQQC